MSRRPYHLLDVKDALAILYSQGITSIHFDDFLELFCEKRGVSVERERNLVRTMIDHLPSSSVWITDDVINMWNMNSKKLRLIITEEGE